jgi:predicted phosphodiesterase
VIHIPFTDCYKYLKDIDIVIHTGDCTNPRDPYNNEPEVRRFIDWYRSTYLLNIKSYVAGNHDSTY